MKAKRFVFVTLLLLSLGAATIPMMGCNNGGDPTPVPTGEPDKSP